MNGILALDFQCLGLVNGLSTDLLSTHSHINYHINETHVCYYPLLFPILIDLGFDVEFCAILILGGGCCASLTISWA